MTSPESNVLAPRLNLVAWELTKRCNLFCAHCRGSSTDARYDNELSTAECYRIIDEIAEVGKPILIMSGGEPLMRSDIFDIAGYALQKGLRPAMGTNGTLIDKEVAERLKGAGLNRIAVSLDFPGRDLQDSFRGKKGAFDAVMAGISAAKNAGLEIQINSTVTRMNVRYLKDLLALALEIGAVAFHPFMLVPTGRGKGLQSVELTPQEYEDTLAWIFERQLELGDRMFFKPTDAPHYMRIMKQLGKSSDVPQGKPGSGRPPAHAITRGCLAGTGFCFISHRGRVQGCGYLDVEAGNVRQQSFGRIWNESPLFRDLRHLDLIKGKCGDCEYKRICGGCRARAYETTGDYLEAEPYCIYQPAAWKTARV
jgi:heme b synthase